MKQVKQNILSLRIREARKNAHLTQSALAKRIGMSDKTISAYEIGTCIPPLIQLKNIASLTNHPLSYFTEENNDAIIIVQKLQEVERELKNIRNILEQTKN